MEILNSLTTSSWQESFSQAKQTELTTAIEDGQILYFPQLAFSLSESELTILSPEYVSTKSKNISFDLMTDQTRGLSSETPTEKAELIRAMLERFAKQ
ncbi:MAG: Kdo hydroxylase family protein, partial [Gammaproteobacteria bacterium]